MDAQLVQEIELLHDRMCKAVGDPKRVMLLYTLVEAPRYVSELANILNLPQPTVSRHLKILRDCGLVKTNREGAAVYYALTDERVIQALDLMRGMLRDRIRDQAQVVDLYGGREA